MNCTPGYSVYYYYTMCSAVKDWIVPLVTVLDCSPGHSVYYTMCPVFSAVKDWSTTISTVHYTDTYFLLCGIGVQQYPLFITLIHIFCCARLECIPGNNVHYIGEDPLRGTVDTEMKSLWSLE